MSPTILMNAGPWLPVPPQGYGGIETVVATLVPELRQQGFRVVLATVGTSTLEADDYIRTLDGPQLPRVAQPYNLVSGIAHAHMHTVTTALDNGLQVDLVHDHLEVVGPAVLAAMGDQAPPTLQTLHWDLAKHPEFYTRFQGRGRVCFAAVSQSQLARAPQNLQDQTLGVVPLAAAAPTPVGDEALIEQGEHALVLARITSDKGQDIAARACHAAGVPLVLAGPVAGIDDPHELERRLAEGDAQLAGHPDVRYFLDHVQPLLNDTDVRWVGAISGAAKERLLQSARVLLSPLRWAEPGATAVVEALTRGVPVVATPLGVLPSLVTHGKNGYLAQDETEMALWLGKLDAIEAETCRSSAARWTPRAMATSYVDLYRKLLEGTSS
ncbi:MAG: glycosyltransferase [Nocardioides sp.]|nr:glycosyltransferase [Nocardioides sp.]